MTNNKGGKMNELIAEFKKAQSMPLTAYDSRSKTYGAKVRITREGRLYGVTDKHNEYLFLDARTPNGIKMIAISKSHKGADAVVKSSTESTGAPFVNVKNLCKAWFGNDKSKWVHTLSLCDGGDDGIAYYKIEEGDTVEKPQKNPKNGWPADLAHCIRKNNKIVFSIEDIYGFSDELASRHPGNRDIKATIRSYLQRLRDDGLIVFLGDGNYMVRSGLSDLAQ